VRPPAGRIRINAGTHRGRMIEVPPGDAARPTGARVREALFNILTHLEPGIADSSVLDACAGSGALGFEALSRGAAHATFFDTDRAVLRTIEETAAALDFGNRTTVQRADATRPQVNRAEPCGLVFLDPPYASEIAATAPPVLADSGWIGPRTLLVVETSRTNPVLPGAEFTETDARIYGDTTLYFMRYSG
jgi:16S rRNA (guanine966-N2)-methyltransferase